VVKWGSSRGHRQGCVLRPPRLVDGILNTSNSLVPVNLGNLNCTCCFLRALLRKIWPQLRFAPTLCRAPPRFAGCNASFIATSAAWMGFRDCVAQTACWQGRTTPGRDLYLQSTQLHVRWHAMLCASLHNAADIAKLRQTSSCAACTIR
jgi:hypothetical protein